MINKIKKFANKNQLFYKAVYILFLLYSKFYTFLCYVMRVFPVNNKKIVCCNMKGKRYGDNPKYIVDEILKRNLDYDIVWLMKKDIDIELPEGIRKVNYNPLRVIYELVTAKIWIDSNTKQYGTLKRKGQIFIQTWHGSYGLKKIGGDVEKAGQIEKKIIQYNSAIADLMVSNSRMTSEIYRRAFWYSGEIVECGSPRNDIFFENNQLCKASVKRYFKIENSNIALYAPTFRNSFKTDALNLDYYQLKNNLEKRFGGRWVVLIRLHPANIQDAERFIHYDDSIINATNYGVMQELLVASDVLITDYSSCMFDFVTTGKPCFLYASDIGEYEKEQGYYFNIFELPFPVAENNEEMKKNVLSFHEKQYSEKLQKLFEEVGLCESGHACERVVDYIKKWMDEN